MHPPALFFFFNDTATTEIYTLSLHDALPIYDAQGRDVALRRPLRNDLRREASRPAPHDDGSDHEGAASGRNVLQVRRDVSRVRREDARREDDVHNLPSGSCEGRLGQLLDVRLVARILELRFPPQCGHAAHWCGEPD